VIEHLRQIVADAEGHLARAGLAREYLQARILSALQDAGAFREWAFLGGTAVRFLYGLPRFSEDLDFSVLRAKPSKGLDALTEDVLKRLAREGYTAHARLSGARTVASVSLRFPGLPHTLGLSPHREQAMSIKIEVDTNPPAGAGIGTSLVRRHALLHLCHHDRASLLAGKINAFLTRPWTKGRDLFDLAWYLADRNWPEPNLTLLNAALSQMGWTGDEMTERTWRKALLDHLDALDWDQARADVAPFLERPEDLQYVSRSVIAGLLAR